jgi:hypothetical protein
MTAFMNTYEIQQAEVRYADHPVLGPATRTLAELADWTDANSDGWAYWPKPVRAAAKLQALIGTTRAYIDDPERTDATREDLAVALRPIKSFRTRHNADFRIVG